MEKFNIAELLKDCPKGMELDCTMYDNCTLEIVFEGCLYPIQIQTPEGLMNLTKYGSMSQCTHSKCVIFPKGKTTWEKFHRPFEDGDIVTWEDRGSLVAFIYKERKDVALVKHHFALYTGGLGTVTDGEISLVENEIVFATEEEKQKLFDAIKANGYRWNAETKTLEELVKPKFKVGNKVQLKEDIREKRIIDNVLNNCYTVQGYGVILFTDQDKWELTPNKFDVTTLKAFDKVLVRDFDNTPWEIEFFSRLLDRKRFKCFELSYVQCIPYEGNEHLLGTTNNCDDFYKTWEK